MSVSPPPSAFAATEAEVSETDIAVIGMALRVPGARNTREFWENLRGGVSSIRPLTMEELDAAGESPARSRLPNYVAVCADLPDMEGFDAGFFGMSPKEAAVMDPQHRHFLECAWEAMESAARPPEREAGPVGVFAGCGMGSYFYDNVLSHRELVEETGLFLLRHTGNDKDFLTTRASFLFDLKGPSVNVQTACSTSLVAVHSACQSLLARECDMALAGGVTIELPHRRGYLAQEGEILAPDGVCRAFDHRAAGTVFGSGVGVVVLRRLGDALRDGDPIQGVIKATAINNDGAGKAGYLAPSIDGQARAIVEAQGLAGIDADSIQYVECHGTGTYLGDPIEIAALTQAFRQSTGGTGFCRVGSVKTNIGHLDTAAGIVGMIKALLALRHGEIPASLGFERPNPAIDFAGSPFAVADRLTPWPRGAGPRRAAVNALGVGGTNAHAILEAAPAARARPAAGAEGPELIVLSARSRAALDEAGRALAAELERRPDLPLADAAYTLWSGRRHFEHRRVLAAGSQAEAVALLTGGDGRRLHTHTLVPDASGAAFLFPGGGAQHPGMARGLYEGEPVFRAALDEGLGYLPPEAAAEIRAHWLGAESREPQAAQWLLRPSRQLPAILICEVALARLWQARGLKPAALIGHSMGENAAACVAGIMTFREAVGLVRLRGELFDTVTGGGMLSVALDAEALRTRLPDTLDLASVNGPALCVVSGPTDALASFGEALKAEGIETAPVAINIAAHSRMLDPILPRFEAYLRTLRLRPPAIPVVSNLTGTWLTEAQACDPLYWVSHLRSTVRFTDGLALLAADRGRIYVEVGPGRTLASLAKAQGTIPANAILNSLPHADEATDARLAFLAAFGRAWATGLAVDPGLLWQGRDCRRVALPTYPFQHQRYFLDAVERVAPGAAEAVPEKRADIAAWGYRPVWRQSAAALEVEADSTSRTWLVFRDEEPVGQALVARLRAAGHRVTEVVPGDLFGRRGPELYALCPEDGRPGYEALIQALDADGRRPDRLLHLWLMTREERVRPGSSPFHHVLERGFSCLVGLMQAMGEATLHATVVTRGMQAVGDRAPAQPDKATVLGPALVIPKEMPGVTIRTIDVDQFDGASRSGRGRAARTEAPGGDFERLWDDLMAEPATETVAYHRSRRWSLDFSPLPLDPAEAGEAAFREGGVYLVTGGLGDIAGTVCEALARRYRARLVLVGRTILPERALWDDLLRVHGEQGRTGRAIARIRGLEALGAKVLYGCADISNPEELGAVLAEARAAFGPINGVIHAAGLVRDGLVALKSEAEIEAVLAPKIHGTRNLHALTLDDPLDLFVLFSSTSADTAPAGQVDYVAANAYLNAFAEAQSHRAGCRTVAIHWGIWNEIGLAARAVAPARALPPRPAPRGPLFNAWAEDGSGGHCLEGSWSASEGKAAWILDEHRVGSGRAIWPGTGYLEIAAQALREHGVEGGFALEDLVFLRPLHVPDGQSGRVQVRLEPQGDGFRLDVRSLASAGGRSGFRRHAQGRIRLIPGAASRTVAPAPAGGLPAAIPSVQEAHLRFGPRWRVLRSLDLAEGSARARLALDPAYRADLEAGFLLHPALLDIATGCAMALVPGYEAAAALWVPVSYRRVRVHGPLPAEVTSRIRLGASEGEGFASFDISITDAGGALIMEVEGFTVRRLDGGVTLEASEAGIEVAAPRVEAPQASASAARALAALVRQGIRPEEGVEALFRALRAGRPQVVVSSMDLAALRARAAAPPAETAPRPSLFERPESEAAYLAPRTETERALVGFWTELLGIARVGVEDNFFEVGGHSLIAVRLLRKVRERFAADLPISVLFEAPTIAALAALLGDRPGAAAPAGDGGSETAAAGSTVTASPKWLHVVPMQVRADAARTPFFLCAGMFGNVLNLRHLALQIGAERPVYGLQARGLYGEHAPHETFEEMARDYCAEIRAVQPHGPYLLGGFSGGGLAAMAMARRLREEGEEVAAVLLLDTPVPQRVTLSVTDRLTMKAQEFRAKGGGFLTEWLRRRARWEAMRLRERMAAPREVGAEQFHNDAIEAAFRSALDRLVLHAYPGRVILYRPQVQVLHRLSGGRRLDVNRSLIREDNGWSPYLPDLSIVQVSGDHDGMVLEPNVRVLAARMRRHLAEAEAAAVPA
ncbi:type I polyketide synthase [Methylobacterium sp. B4]|uniref:type I polyketide synthase n=1 Tax=Methylobacterium sp. B4 TaxID=1938755 RepID=UPI000D75E9FE|nr:type I polyketide synthase [Methylobacterium sp. B4]PXW62161.1 acyl transferase domain-containing protein [Methylobacterium sp. B4]